MEKIQFELKGLAPLKMDRYVDELQPTTDEEYVKQAEKKIYTDDNGNLAIEAGAVEAVTTLAAVELAGKMKGKAMRQTFMAQFFVNPSKLTILPERKNHNGIDKVMVSRKGPGNKITRVPTYRPLIRDWSIKGEISSVGIATLLVKQALDLAGMKYGLLGHRPKYGRFEVVKFQVVN